LSGGAAGHCNICYLAMHYFMGSLPDLSHQSFAIEAAVKIPSAAEVRLRLAP
jgi:hypothetical protein